MDTVLPAPGPVDEALIEARRGSPRGHSLDDLIGLDEVKTELRAQIRLWAAPEALARLGGAPRSGLLFLGPTGTGKTTAAHALAAETGRALYTFAGPDFHDAAGKDLLATMLNVTARQPAVVFVDEADDLVRTREEYGRRTHGETLVPYLLVGLDRSVRDIAAFFVFATNLDADEVDPALCRPGRLGRPLRFRNLDAAERLALLEHLARRATLAEGTPLTPIATRLADVSTASIAHLFDEAAFVAWRRGATEIASPDLHEAVTRLQAGIPRARPLAGEELRRVAIHEAGHAIAQLVLGGSWDAVAFVAVDARADGELGGMLGDPVDDPLRTEAEVRRDLTVALAGREAERLLAGSVDNGSATDLAAANHLALRAVREWGMSARGPRTALEFSEAIVDGRVDDEALVLLADAETRARQVLEGHRRAVERLAECLERDRAATPTELQAWLSDLLDLDPAAPALPAEVGGS